MRYRSKTLAAWLALVAGPLGVHRFYLHGWADLWGWLHPWPTLLGIAGVLRMRALGQDDHLAWLLIPVLGTGKTDLKGCRTLATELTKDATS